MDGRIGNKLALSAVKQLSTLEWLIKSDILWACWCSETQVGGKSGIGEYRKLKIGISLVSAL